MIVSLFWIGVALQCLTFIELLRRKMAWKLFFFAIFVFLMAARNTTLGLNFNTGRYREIQSITAPYMAALQAAAVIQAYWWLTMSLVNFKRYGIGMFITLTVAAVSFEHWTSAPDSVLHHALRCLYLLERGVGLSLALPTFLSLAAFKHFGAPSDPKWHAFSLVVLSGGNALAWELQNNYILVCSCAVGLLIWIVTVYQPPPWTELAAGEYPAAAIERSVRKAEEASGLRAKYR